MSRKKAFLGGILIALLALLNLLHWGPILWKGKELSSKAPLGWMRLDFPEPLEGKGQKIHRDLFSLGNRAPGTVLARRPVKPAPVPTPAGVPTPFFPDGSVMEAEGGYRLMGVVSRGGKSRALVGQDKLLLQVGEGDGLGDRYLVLAVAQNELDLKDKPTGNTVKLRIWDPTVQAAGGLQTSGGNATLGHD